MHNVHSEIAEIEAKSEGTAILLVTYDAEINKPGMGGSFFSAIWPENTGVVVFTVGNDGSDIQTNMTLNAGRNTETAKTAVDNLDAQIDVLYYLEGAAGAEYTFTPEDGVAVSVLHPQITGNKLTYSGFKGAMDMTPLTGGKPGGGSEDFAFVSHEVPTVSMFLAAGNAKEGYTYGQHHPKVRFDDSILYRGTAAYTYMALRWLAEHQ